MTQEQFNNLMACKVIAQILFNDVSEIELDLRGSDNKGDIKHLQTIKRALSRVVNEFSLMEDVRNILFNLDEINDMVELKSKG